MSLPELIPSNLPVFTRKTPRSNFANSVVPQGSALLFAQSDSNGGVRFVTKNSDGSYTDVGGGGSEVTAGYFAKDGDNLKFYATESSSGELVEQIMIADTGKDQPEYQGSSGSTMNFYRCSSVDTSNSAWTGNLASVDPVTGVWSFAETATSGLSFDRLTPVVGNVYDEKCVFQIINFNGFLKDGLVFDLPLRSSTTTTTGQIVTTAGSVPFTTVHGLSSATFSGESTNYLSFSDSNFPSGSNTRTLCFWFCPTQYDQNDCNIVNYGIDGNGTRFGIFYSDNRIDIGFGGGNTVSFYPNINIDEWSFICLIVADSSIKLSVNGTQYTSTIPFSFDTMISSGYVCHRNQTNAFTGNLCGIKLYNRALNNSEIFALASQFTPVQE